MRVRRDLLMAVRRRSFRVAFLAEDVLAMGFRDDAAFRLTKPQMHTNVQVKVKLKST
jgi:hypothetical protein